MAQRASLLLAIAAVLCSAAAVADQNFSMGRGYWESFVVRDPGGLCGDLFTLFNDTIAWGTTLKDEYYVPGEGYHHWTTYVPSCKWEYHGNHTETVAIWVNKIKGGTVTVYSDNMTTSDDSSLMAVPVEVNGWVGISFEAGASTKEPRFHAVVGPIDWTSEGGHRPLLRARDSSWNYKGTSHCENGGVHNSLKTNGESCHCPPGFAGPHCLQACGPDRYGAECEKTCSGTLRGCRGFKFSRFSFHDSVESCAAGFFGPACDKMCRNGTYGADCDQTCGQCDSGESCDPCTGLCPAGCQPGFGGPYCKDELLHIVNGLVIASVTESSISGSVTFSAKNVEGRGSVKYLQVQTKKSDKGYWQTGVHELLRLPLDPCTQRADIKTTKTSTKTIFITPCCTYNFVLEGMRHDTTFDVRVLLLDEKKHSFFDVPYVRVTTLGQSGAGRVSSLPATENSINRNLTLLAFN